MRQHGALRSHSRVMSTEDGCCRSSDAHMWRFTHQNHEAYLCVRIGDQIYDCLLDTESEVTIFPESVIRNADVMRTNKTLRAANESAIPILGEVNLTVGIGNYYTQVVGLVSEHIPEPMLSIDFLKSNKAFWDL